MFNELKKMVILNQEQNLENFDQNQQNIQKLKQRIDDLDSQMELLKKMSQPSGDGGIGILDALNEMTDRIRAEFDDKINDLLKKINKIKIDFN